MRSPASAWPGGGTTVMTSVPALDRPSAGDCVTGMLRVLVAGADSAESAVTVFERLPPASTSGWLTVWLQARIQVSASWRLPSALPSPLESAGGASHIASETVIADSVTLPVLVTVKP